MTTDELKELLGKVTPGEWRVEYSRGTTKIIMGDDCTMCDETYYPWVPENLNDWELIALAPYLARRVIAADKLVDALIGASEDLDDYSPLTGNAIETNAAKQCRDALAEYEATK